MRLGLDAGQDTISIAVELNIRGVPIAGEGLVQNGVRATLAPLNKHGLEPCQVGAFGYNPLADKNCNGQLSQIIPLAKEAGCRHIAIGPGNYHPSGFGHYDTRNFQENAIDLYAQSLRPMVELAQKHDVVLTIEAYLKGVVCSADTFKRLHAMIGSDHLRCNIDPSSLYAGLHDFLNPMPLVTRTIADLAQHVGLVHLKEVAVEEGFHLKMSLAPIGSGHTDWAELLACVDPHLPEDSWVIIEHCASPGEASKSVDIITRAAAQAGTVFV